MSHPVIITFDQNQIDFAATSALLKTMRWGAKRTDEIHRRAFSNSICAIALLDRKQVGFARARASVDRATFARLADVIVWPQARGLGVGKALVGALLSHPDLKDVLTWMLTTDDAHGLYARYGFVPVAGENNLRLDR